MLYHMGDSRHTQNIQINKVIGENEKCVFYFMEKIMQSFWPTQHVPEGITEAIRLCHLYTVLHGANKGVNADVHLCSM